MTVSLLPLLSTLGAVLAVVDAVFRIRRPGNGSLLAVLELPLGLLLFVQVFAPVHRYVSTTIQYLPLAIPLAVVLLLLVIVKSSRKSGLLWLALAALIANGAAIALTLTHFKL